MFVSEDADDNDLKRRFFRVGKVIMVEHNTAGQFLQQIVIKMCKYLLLKPF